MEQLFSKIDHTLLSTTSTWEQVQQLCDEGKKYQCASVCVPPRYVRKASQYIGKGLKVCTVIGFPNGYSTPECKIFETEEAVRAGADEIDMVINLGLVKSGDWEGVLTEIREVKRSCGGRILKVIIETDLLSQEEKISACRTVSMSGAEFIKTSTGFVGGGATVEDIALLKEHCSPEIRIKASGGIDNIAKAKKLLEAGANRLGSSKLLGLLVKEQGLA